MREAIANLGDESVAFLAVAAVSRGLEMAQCAISPSLARAAKLQPVPPCISGDTLTVLSRRGRSCIYCLRHKVHFLNRTLRRIEC